VDDVQGGTVVALDGKRDTKALPAGVQPENVPLRTTIELFFHLKKVIIEAEQCGMDTSTYLQPLIQQRGAFDHICRALGAELGVSAPDLKARDAFGSQEVKEQYIATNHQKAMAHLYRGFFDAADWYTIELWEVMKNDLDSFPPRLLLDVVPDYIVKKARITEISDACGALRGEKDVGTPSEAIEQVEAYRKNLKELLQYKREFAAAIPALVDLEKKERLQAKRNLRTAILAVILAAVLGSIGTYMVGVALDRRKAKNTPVLTPPPPAIEAPAKAPDPSPSSETESVK